MAMMSRRSAPTRVRAARDSLPAYAAGCAWHWARTTAQINLVRINADQRAGSVGFGVSN
jgi:hypothetical protein